MKPYRACYLAVIALATSACWLTAAAGPRGGATAAPAVAGEMHEQNKQIALRFDQALSDHDLSELDSIVAPDVVDHNADPGEAPGLAGVKQGLQGLLSAFPDVQVTTEQLVAENDLVADYASATGTNTGSLFGIPPTGRSITSHGMEIFRIQNGVITEIWHLDDAAAQLMQPG